MKSVIYTEVWASGGMADTSVLGTDCESSEGSSPFSPTTKVTRWLKFVTQGVALAINCYARKKYKGVFPTVF
tara:strand:+ start:95 stop:310 length:216 start_codon:yes stop_codon:yes gene_type:complete